MRISADEVITWLIVGALAGSLAGMVVKWRREGFGPLMNLAIGLIGGLIGGLVFKILKINLGIVGGIAVTSEDVVEAFVGALIFLAAVWIMRKLRAARSTTIETPTR